MNVICIFVDLNWILKLHVVDTNDYDILTTDLYLNFEQKKGNGSVCKLAWKIVKSSSNESFEKFAKIPIEFTTKKLGEGKNPLAIFGHLCQEKILYSETMYILGILFYCTSAFTTFASSSKR